MNSLARQILGKLRVLVVDDHQINRDFLQAGLFGLVAEVVVVDDGQTAVDLCKTEHFDVILMDLHMPRMDGLSACQRIRQSGTASENACILILTADARPEAQNEQPDECGANGYLSKPAGIQKVAYAIIEQLAPGTPFHQQLALDEGETRLIAPERALESANGDPDLVQRMGRMFAKELEEKLPLLDAMMERGELPQALKIIHQWKGSCGFAGTSRLHHACENLHRSLSHPNTQSVGSAYVEFVRTAHATRQALQNVNAVEP
ncbi:MAG: response regulator [Wenzhouxiangella sp.]|nr:response regulator [Wenzhouxiangella sp.]